MAGSIQSMRLTRLKVHWPWRKNYTLDKIHEAKCRHKHCLKCLAWSVLLMLWQFFYARFAKYRTRRLSMRKSPPRWQSAPLERQMVWRKQRRIWPPQKRMTTTTRRLWEDQHVLAWRLCYLVVTVNVPLKKIIQQPRNAEHYWPSDWQAISISTQIVC